MADKYEVLKTYYGYDSFRDGQEQIIDRILMGQDVLAVMPTGSGKSLCYQIPAIMFPGITLVISPLISLMKDQVGALNQNGIRAAYLNSSLTSRQYTMALDNIKKVVYKIIYVAPERLITDSFKQLAMGLDISFIAVDEAHCVSQWGHDFRTSYTKISDFYESLKKRPTVAAFTATATKHVKDDIRIFLKLRLAYEITTGFDRPNLYFGVCEPEDKIGYIVDYLTANKDRSGIIYAMTRKNVENIHRELLGRGFPVTYYHAGLGDEERNANQESFIRDKTPIMIATNAFGMGIDKPDVSFILHFNMPLSMEAYYQEAGRAGRDGGESDCILLFSPADIHLAKFLLENSTEDDPVLDAEELELLKKKRFSRLRDMIQYCRTAGCLRRYILRYFGEEPESKPCAKCSSCRSEYDAVDATDIAVAVGIAIEATGERYGAMFVADYLHGTQSGRPNQLGYSDGRAFGLLSDVPVGLILEVIEQMVESGLLLKCGGKYPVLGITPVLGRRRKKEAFRPMLSFPIQRSRRSQRRVRRTDAPCL